VCHGELVSDLLRLLDDLSGARRRDPAADSGLDAPPPGIPALPPDPRLVSRGVAGIRAHDPTFDEGAVVDQARSLWTLMGREQAEQRTDLLRGAISDDLLAWLPATEGLVLRDAAVSAVEAGGDLDAVTVRLLVERTQGLVLAALDHLVGGHEAPIWEEDWVFQRSAGATTPVGSAEAGRCPTCGAPLRRDAAGSCAYCHATVLAAPGWVLTGRHRLRPMTPQDAAALAAGAQAGRADPSTAAPPPPPAALADGVDLGALGGGGERVDPYSLLATVRETVYAVAAARSQRRPELAAGRVTAALAGRVREEAGTEAARRRHHVLAFLEVGDAVVTSATQGPEGDRVTVRLHLTGEEYELADATLEVVEGSPTMRSWSEEWVFERSGPSAPWLAGGSSRPGDAEAATRG
jgi:hypothetical protein